MAEWTKVGANVLVGAGAGVGDQLIQDWDTKREEERGERLGIMKQGGTYYNYGVPILAILAAAFNFLRGDWATRAIVAGSQLAGRKATWQITQRKATPWKGWKRNPNSPPASSGAMVGREI